MAETLLLVHTPRQRFVVSKADVYALRTVGKQEAMPQAVHVALGTLFDPLDVSILKRQHGMVVPLRRKEITLLVDRIDMLDNLPVRHALPALLYSRLQDPWSIAAFEIESRLVIQLDVRAIARSLFSNLFYGHSRI